MKSGRSHLVHDALVMKDFSDGRKQLIATAPIAKDELLIVWGGRPVTRAELEAQDSIAHSLSVQIEDDIYLLQFGYEEGDCINHSCEPNAGIRGQVCVVAIRDIAAGEVISYDYCMTDTTDYDQFACLCGSSQCRTSITGVDWQRKDLRQRYAGYFAIHVQRAINALTDQQ